MSASFIVESGRIVAEGEFVAYVEVVILSAAKDLLSYQCKRQQILRFAQDDNCDFLRLKQRYLSRIRLTAFAAAVGCSYYCQHRH